MQLYKNFCKETTDENGKLTSFELVFPENYNFGYDVVDKMAELVPNDTAVVWTNPEKEEKIFTYSDISKLSNKAANVFRNHGIKKGDKVLVILKRNYEYWYVAPALHKLGAVIIPATNLLTQSDISYRVNTAGIKAAVLPMKLPPKIRLRLHLSRTHLKPFLFRESKFSVRLILPKKLKTLPIPLKELKQKQKSLW